MNFKNVIITGPTGVVGISLINECIKKGIYVTAVCRSDSKRLSNIPKSEFVSIVECNLNNINQLKNRLGHNYDAFYHFAWDGTYGSTRLNKQLQENNVVYTLAAIDLSKVLGCRVFIGAGSQSEYGHINGIITESTKCNPDNPYGESKLEAYKQGLIRSEQLGLRFQWCRIISMYGPCDGPWSLIMSTLIKMLHNEDTQFTNCDQLWNYIYSKDAARIFLAAGENGVSPIYNIGSTESHTLKYYIKIMANVANYKNKLGFGMIPYYPNQIMHLKVDMKKVKNELGISQEYDFIRGIEETFEWVKSNY